MNLKGFQTTKGTKITLVNTHMKNKAFEQIRNYFDFEENEVIKFTLLL